MNEYSARGFWSLSDEGQRTLLLEFLSEFNGGGSSVLLMLGGTRELDSIGLPAMRLVGYTISTGIKSLLFPENLMYGKKHICTDDDVGFLLRSNKSMDWWIVEEEPRIQWDAVSCSPGDVLIGAIRALGCRFLAGRPILGDLVYSGPNIPSFLTGVHGIDVIKISQ